jgi:hypothetical protein
MHLLPGVAIQPNLELKTRPKLVLGSLPLAFALPGVTLQLPLCAKFRLSLQGLKYMYLQEPAFPLLAFLANSSRPISLGFQKKIKKNDNDNSTVLYFDKSVETRNLIQVGLFNKSSNMADA